METNLNGIVLSEVDVIVSNVLFQSDTIEYVCPGCKQTITRADVLDGKTIEVPTDRPHVVEITHKECQKKEAA